MGWYMFLLRSFPKAAAEVQGETEEGGRGKRRNNFLLRTKCNQYIGQPGLSELQTKKQLYFPPAAAFHGLCPKALTEGRRKLFHLILFLSPNPKTQPVPSLERGEAKWNKLRWVTSSAALGPKSGLETLTGYHSSPPEESGLFAQRERPQSPGN